jgi:hypothetical protein
MDQDMGMPSESMELSGGGGEFEEHQGHSEREVAFKLLAAHAMVDAEFYQRLREDPASAAAELHIMLDDGDLEYLQGVVNWEVLDKYAGEIREALQPERAIRSPLW